MNRTRALRHRRCGACGDVYDTDDQSLGGSPIAGGGDHGFSPWPGNVRELENACERISQTCTCNQVRCGCMPASILFQPPAAAVLPPPRETLEQVGAISLDDRLEEVESHLITWALKASHRNKSKAAELLQIKRSTLGDRIRKLGLEEQGGES